jgi:hypothetical protein
MVEQNHSTKLQSAAYVLPEHRPRSCQRKGLTGEVCADRPDHSALKSDV